MKTWMFVPVAAVALAIGLFLAPSTPTVEPVATAHASASSSASASAAAFAQSSSTRLIVRVAVADMAPDVMSDACVFSAEAMAAGAPAQCGAKVVPAMFGLGEESHNKALVWPGDFFEITVSAAVEAWDATLSFVGSLFGIANEDDLDI
ncbi:hypothetical protein sos41_38310 [Alphaproteobacteria bacterium SO-S41]|nr:hypothetical protein sos41_38310 [Alphaproteobacteria bacterium SO-S41]